MFIVIGKNRTTGQAYPERVYDSRSEAERVANILKKGRLFINVRVATKLPGEDMWLDDGLRKDRGLPIVK